MKVLRKPLYSNSFVLYYLCDGFNYLCRLHAFVFWMSHSSRRIRFQIKNGIVLHCNTQVKPISVALSMTPQCCRETSIWMSALFFFSLHHGVRIICTLARLVNDAVLITESSGCDHKYDDELTILLVHKRFLFCLFYSLLCIVFIFIIFQRADAKI